MIRHEQQMENNHNTEIQNIKNNLKIVHRLTLQNWTSFLEQLWTQHKQIPEYTGSNFYFIVG